MLRLSHSRPTGKGRNNMLKMWQDWKEVIVIHLLIVMLALMTMFVK